MKINNVRLQLILNNKRRSTTPPYSVYKSQVREELEIDLTLEFKSVLNYRDELHRLLDLAISNAQIEYSRYAKDGC